MFKVSKGCKIPLGFSYSTFNGRTCLYISFPFWLSKKSVYSFNYDTFLFGWKMKVISFRLQTACTEQKLGKQIDTGLN